MERAHDIPNQQTPDEQKLMHLILYVAQESVDDPDFGATKLSKILFYVDFGAYRARGKSITGYPYKKLERGPVLTRMKPLLDRMQMEGYIDVEVNPVFSYAQHRVIARKSPDLTLFEPGELELVRFVLRSLKGKNADKVSKVSHNFIGWRAMRLGEEIPYALALIGVADPTDKMIETATRLDLVAKRLHGASA